MEDLEGLKARLNADQGYMGFNGVSVTALERGFCACRAAMSADKTNPLGIAHGGFLFSLCDCAAGIAGLTLGKTVVGRAAEIHFLHTGRGSAFTAQARIMESGRKMTLAEVEVRNDQDRLIAYATFDMFFVDKEQMGQGS